MTTSPVEKKTGFRWQRTTLQIAIVTSILTVIYKSMDNYTMHNLITSSDRFTDATVYLVLGGWTGLFLALILMFTVGKVVEPDFNGLVVFDKTMQKSAFVSGVISGGSTLFLLMGNQLGDPSFILALGNLSILYVMLYEVTRRHQSVRPLLLPALIVIVGGAMAAYTGSIHFTLLGIFYVVGLSNVLRAISEVIEKTGATAGGALNMYIWRFFWLCATGTVIAVVVMLVRGTTVLYRETFINALQNWKFILLTMSIVWFANAYGLYMKRSNPVTLVMVVLSLQLALSFPATLLGDALWPDAFGDIPGLFEQPLYWIIRIAGGLIIVYGVYLLQKQNPSIKNRIGE